MNQEHSRLQGSFQLPDNQEVFGELLLNGPQSLLTLTSQSELPLLREVSHLLGTTLDRKKVTCIDCIRSAGGNAGTHHHVHVFPHFVTVGDEHIDPGLPLVRGIDFTVDDLPSLFYDFDAFGFVIDANPIMDTILAERRRMRPVETGEWPLVAYFTGRTTVTEVRTDLGKVRVSHQPSFDMGGPQGVFIKNRMMVSLDAHSPVSFVESIDRMMVIVRFLSVIAGRRQGVHDISLRTAALNDEARQAISVYWSYAHRGPESTDDGPEPHPIDLPLNPIQRPEEFKSVLKNWIRREANWHQSRVRYIDCLGMGNFYNSDRLIAAANMFDILPAEAAPPPAALPNDIVKSQAACVDILKKHPPSPDRDAAISALKRMGKPSLPKKIQYRREMVEKHALRCSLVLFPKNEHFRFVPPPCEGELPAGPVITAPLPPST